MAEFEVVSIDGYIYPLSTIGYYVDRECYLIEQEGVIMHRHEDVCIVSRKTLKPKKRYRHCKLVVGVNDGDRWCWVFGRGYLAEELFNRLSNLDWLTCDWFDL